ncbi:MAG: 50S ribosomal protein L9 [Deltaproteobacteria bacterium]|nr:MAG: 50S ribosomal protein L9 [Deltaproteobacteria bacterium]
MKLILVESIHRLGEAGDLVSVKPGFARNFLLPQGKALLATESRVKEFDHKRRIAEEKAARELKDLEAVKGRLETLKIEIGARAGESGKLFGSVTAAQIADKIEAAGLKIDRRRIDLREPIKEVGEHKVAVKLLRELIAQISITVVAEGGPSPEEEEETPEDIDDRRGRGRRRREDDEGEEEEDERDRAKSEESAPRE